MLCAAFKNSAAAHIYNMSDLLKIKIAATSALAAACVFLCSCTIDTNSSLKELTDPYITRYECTYAACGDKEFLDEFDYIRITLTDKENMELSYRKKGDMPRMHSCRYSFNEKTGELTAEGGALGVKFKERVIIENGKFTISFPISGKELVLRFES